MIASKGSSRVDDLVSLYLSIVFRGFTFLFMIFYEFWGDFERRNYLKGFALDLSFYGDLSAGRGLSILFFLIGLFCCCILIFEGWFCGV